MSRSLLGKMVRLNHIRIIGGRWRGRKITFPDLDTLRPTPNRVRETLFNWLMPVIRGATCLDMFAGSGSLSFEALSRGAGRVVLWEPEQNSLKALKENAERLQTTSLEVYPIRFPQNLPIYPTPQFDIVFLDPPFHQHYIEPACQWLVESNCLKKDALIYIEMEYTPQPPTLPEGWEILKAKKAGDVSYYLVKQDGSVAKK